MTGSGLRPTKPDDRDFSFGAIWNYPDISTLPKSYTIKTLGIKHQLDSDCCTAFAVSVVSEAQEGIELAPEYIFAKTKELDGSWESWGADLRLCAKSVTKFGSITQKENPFKLAEKGRDFIANWENWSKDYDTLAEEHKKRAYFSIEAGKLDLFDSIKSAMWRFKDENRAVLTGVVWSTEWSGNKIVDYKGVPLFGHAIAVVGWEEIDGKEYLIIQNSYGENVGDKGLFYFSREIVNDRFLYGAFMFADMPLTKEEIIEKSQWYRASVVGKLWIAIKGAFTSLGNYYDNRYSYGK